MTSQLNPYLNFPGTARQAMEFYRSVFGGTLSISTFGEYGDGDAPDADKLMHARLDTERGYTLMAADLPTGMEHTPGGDITVSLTGDDAADLRRYWEQLSADGVVTMPFERQVWGDEFGMCVDRFGIAWMVNITQPEG